MMLSKKFTRREKVLMFILALLLVFAVYFLFVQNPVKNALDGAASRKAQLETELTVLQVKQARYDSMQAELEETLSDPNAAEVPAYDNLKNVMSFLNSVLGDSEDFSLNFGAVKHSDEGKSSVVRRTVTMSFTKSDYDEARAAVEALQSCPYCCKLGDISFQPDRYWYRDSALYWANRDWYDTHYFATLQDSPVEVSLSMTFYETEH